MVWKLSTLQLHFDSLCSNVVVFAVFTHCGQIYIDYCPVDVSVSHVHQPYSHRFTKYSHLLLYIVVILAVLWRQNCQILENQWTSHLLNYPKQVCFLFFLIIWISGEFSERADHSQSMKTVTAAVLLFSYENSRSWKLDWSCVTDCMNQSGSNV